MSNKLIKKIEAEQREIDNEAFFAMMKALGFSQAQQETVYSHYRWMRAISKIKEEVDTPRIQKVYQTARETYLLSLKRTIQDLPQPLKLADWTRAGKAMKHVFKKAYDRTRN